MDKPKVVLVHGLKGSFLKHKETNSRMYFTASTLINWGADQFPLPLERLDGGKGAQKADSLVPDGVIESVEVLGVTISTVYRPLIEYLRREGRDVHLFDYDWRRELQETSDRLEVYLDSLLREDKSGMGVQLIVHSMGGLVTFPLINKRPDLFHSVLFGAAALGASFNFLQDVSVPGNGNYTGPINSRMITPSHWLSWPSPYHFFPLKGERATTGRSTVDQVLFEKDAASGEEGVIDFDSHDILDWKKYGLGPYHPLSGVTMDAAKEDFFSETLRRAKLYRQQLVFDDCVDYPVMSVLTSDAHETTVGYGRDTRTGVWGFARPLPSAGKEIHLHKKTVAGDNRIAVADASPPPRVPIFKEVLNKAPHAAVLNDVLSVGQLLQDMTEEAGRRGKGKGGRK